MVLLAGLALVPLLLGTVLFLSQDTALDGQGPGFVGRVTGNGLFLVVASLFLCLPFLLPLTIGIASGDAIAGEASAGTLRYLLTVPVARGRLLAVKAVGALTFAAAAVARDRGRRDRGRGGVLRAARHHAAVRDHRARSATASCGSPRSSSTSGCR